MSQDETMAAAFERELVEAIALVRIGAEAGGYRVYPGGGGMWAGRNNDLADATFVDWGLARATATILNAVLIGRLVPACPQGDARSPLL